jgi:type II secretory pathway pseudopilin PulG
MTNPTPRPASGPYQPQPWPVASIDPAPPRRSPKWPWILVVIGTVLVLAAVMVTTAFIATRATPDRTRPTPAAVLTEQAAQRECRTAFQKEWDTRNERLRADKDPDDDTFATVQSVEVQETWKTPAGYNVNGTVHYSLNNLAGTFNNTLDLTCIASGTDTAVRTIVNNRH